MSSQRCMGWTYFLVCSVLATLGLSPGSHGSPSASFVASQTNENKKNVFTEFTVTVEAVHKATNQQPTESSVLTVDRIGGFVRYPNFAN